MSTQNNCNWVLELRKNYVIKWKVLWGWWIQIRAAGNGPLQCICDPVLAEAMAARETLKWIKDQSLTNLRLETDCLVLCSSLSNYVSLCV